MLKENKELIKNSSLLMDLGVTVLSFFGSYFLTKHFHLSVKTVGEISKHLDLLYLIIPIWTLVLYLNVTTSGLRTKTIFQIILPVIKCTVIAGNILFAALFIFKLQFVSRLFIVNFLILSTLFLLIQRFCIFKILTYLRQRKFNTRNILIIGTGKRAREFAQTLIYHREWGLNIVGFLDRDSAMNGKSLLGKKVLGSFSNFRTILKTHQVDKVIFIAPRSWLDLIEEIVTSCEEIGIKVQIACDFFPKGITNLHLSSLTGRDFLTLTPPPYNNNLLVVKRMIDVVFSLAILTLTAPLLIFVALVIKITSPGPIFFKQKRCGLNRKNFWIYKFRTMVCNAEELRAHMNHLNEMSGPTFKAKDDPRITGFGEILRKFSLDEFPQFLNVLKGEMSIVGPRPPLPSEVEKYDMHERRRLSMKPGITCLWQINGRNKIGFDEWVQLDLKYIDNWSLAMDVKIALLTVPVVLKGSGI